MRAAGLSEAWSPKSESSEEVLAKLLADGVDGKRVVVQLHGEPQPEMCAVLRAAGAEVLEVPVYRWVPPEDVRAAKSRPPSTRSSSASRLSFGYRTRSSPSPPSRHLRH